MKYDRKDSAEISCDEFLEVPLKQTKEKRLSLFPLCLHKLSQRIQIQTQHPLMPQGHALLGHPTVGVVPVFPTSLKGQGVGWGWNKYTRMTPAGAFRNTLSTGRETHLR